MSAGDTKLFDECRKGSAAERAELELSPMLSESKLANTEINVQDLDYIKDSFDNMAARFNVAKKALKRSEENVQFLEKKIAERSSQVDAKKATATGYRRRVSTLRN